MRISSFSPVLVSRVLLNIIKRAVGELTGKAVVPESAQASAYHPGLLFATSVMEALLPKTVPARLKILASSAAARMTGCPF